jgi:hypothetical protein
MLSQVEKEIPELEEQLRSIKGALHDFNVSEPLYVHTFNKELVHAEVLCLFPHFCIRFLTRYTQAMIFLTSELWATTEISRVHNVAMVLIVRRSPFPQLDIALAQGLIRKHGTPHISLWR